MKYPNFQRTFLILKTLKNKDNFNINRAFSVLFFWNNKLDTLSYNATYLFMEHFNYTNRWQIVMRK